MGGAGIGIKLGYLNFSRGSFKKSVDEDNEFTLHIPSRDGMTLSIPINLGSSGFGWILEPYLGLGSELKSIGLMLGPTIVIHLNDPLYFGFGISFRAGYLLIDDIDLGLDAYARIPVTITYYIIDQLGIVAELGLGYGATGIKYKDVELKVFNPDTGEIEMTTESVGLGFGTAVQIDFSVGVRLP